MMDSGYPTFSFHPLSGPTETRLLRLDPGQDNEPLSGRLEHADLDDQPAYEALSYEWGSSQKHHSIRINSDSVVFITESLHQTLLDLRHSSPANGSRTLWVDAICINQTNTTEVQAQVSMMARIFRSAARVVTYIGPERDGSTEAIEMAATLLYYSSSRNGGPDPRLFDNIGLSQLGLPLTNDPRWKNLRALVLRSWASRCWCALEFLHNRNLIMMCGKTCFSDWQLIPSLVQSVVNRQLSPFFVPTSSKDPHSIKECLMHLGRLRTSIVDHEASFSLIEILQYAHPFQATDPRDKIYSVIGLANDAASLNLKIDYTCTVEELYIKVASRILEVTPVMDIIYSNLHAKSLNLPSWVPDWSTWHYGSYGASGESDYAPTRFTELEMQVRGRVLDVTGSLIDRIESVSEPLGPYYVDHDKLCEKRQKFIKAQLDAFMRIESHPDVTNSSSVFWRTLIGNITFDENTATEAYGSKFYAHLQCHDKSPDDVVHQSREFCDAARRKSRYRRLATLRKGYFGAVPQTAQVGDWVCTIHGGRHLYVLREQEEGFSYIGHAFFHELMYGEALYASWYKPQTITLV